MSKPKIIVVDDSRSIHQRLRTPLENAGFEVISADNGQSGLDALNAHPDAKVALCDIHMPILNGLELLEAVQGRVQDGSLTVLMLTAERAPKMILKARQLGAKGWLRKPFDPAKVVATLRHLQDTADKTP